ncbi:hypothetical protein BD413DRAFT_234967 [Trametes elegans]|nr:hypothetical protein BD413DRAFT_234967 [Trametes elegans]
MGGLSQLATRGTGSEEYLYHDYSGSQATVERLSNTGQKRKRKGSEDDLVVLDPGSSLAKDGGSPHSTRRALVPETRKRPAGAKPFIFTSDWQLSKEQVGNNWKKPKPVSTGSLPLELNDKGKATRPVQLGSRKRLCSRG